MYRDAIKNLQRVTRRLAGAWKSRSEWGCQGLRDNRGSFLLETVVASMVFSMVGVAVLSSLGTVNIAGALTEEQSQAENIARNQMENIFNRAYREPGQTPYPTVVLPQGYSVASAVTPLTYTDDMGVEHTIDDPEVEKITLTVSNDGKELLQLETARYRTDALRLAYSYSETRPANDRHVLHNATIDGTVYIFLDDPNLLVAGPVDFYLNKSFINQEQFVHWDFQGSGGVNPEDPANPWNTGSKPDGQYEILAKTVLNNGETVNVTAQFTIDN